MRNVDDYLSLPYHVTVIRDEDESGPGWFARVEELDGCMTQVRSLGQLEERLRDAMASWIEAVLEDGDDVPLPRQDDTYPSSGKFLVRVPKTLHRALADEAERDGVSLNQFVVAALAAAVAWRRPGHTAPSMPA